MEAGAEDVLAEAAVIMAPGFTPPPVAEVACPHATAIGNLCFTT